MFEMIFNVVFVPDNQDSFLIHTVEILSTKVDILKYNIKKNYVKFAKYNEQGKKKSGQVTARRFTHILRLFFYNFQSAL